MHPEINILGRSIPVYGIMFYAGIAATAAVAFIICKRRNIPRFDVAGAGVYTMIGAILGSKLLFIAVSYKQIIALGLTFTDIIKGGFVFYGGLLGGAIGLLIYTKQFKLPLDDYMDLFAAVIPLGHAIGRIGCFFAGCCYGIPYNGRFSFTYTASFDINTPIGVPLLPVQLIESAVLLIVFAMTVAAFIKFSDKKGVTSSVYMCAYSAARFVLEFFRGDSERGKFWGLSTSQYIGILIFIFGVVFCIKRINDANKTGRSYRV